MQNLWTTALLKADRILWRSLWYGPPVRDGLHTGPLEVNDEGHRQRYADPQVRALQAAMRARPEPSLPCMNDLLTENFIDVSGLLLLIDADDSANRQPSDELGNISGARRTLRSFI